ncbi:MAG: uracil-DNA glycosylase, partial [Haloechinothrix sp.]
MPGHQPLNPNAAHGIAELDAAVSQCRACPRLVAWREQVAATKRASYADQIYWGRPVPGFGPADAALAIVGLAPAAHGANRTGRMFTGDRSGDVLYAALHAVGLASQPHATHRDDGLVLRGTRITAPVHCAPPGNKPTPAERDACRPWLARELELLRPTLRAVVVLGAFGWQALLPTLEAAGYD